jgi:Flp pilus assembly secretin CpaC
MDGIPGLGTVPGLNQFATSNDKQHEEDELLIVITPHIVQGREASEASEVWLKP